MGVGNSLPACFRMACIAGGFPDTVCHERMVLSADQESLEEYFVSWTPLEWLYDTFGSKGYIVSLLGLATMVNIVAYGVCNGVWRRCKKC